MTVIGRILTQLMHAGKLLFRKKKNDIEFHENLTHDLVAAMTSQGERYVVFT